MAGSGSLVSATRVIAATAASNEGWSPSPTAASIAAPSPEVSYVCGRDAGSPKMSAVSWTAAGLCDPPPETRTSVTGTFVRFTVRSMPSRRA